MKTAQHEVVAHLLNVDALAAQNHGDSARAESMRHIAKHCKAGTEGALKMDREERAKWAAEMAE